jgi:division protein CdvB (Snf7/Vps24/ESCRT-III family)
VKSGDLLILGNNFINNWNKEKKESSILSKFKDSNKSKQGLKQQIKTVIQRIEGQKNKLNNASKRFEQRDATLFKRITKALTERDAMRANVLASELAEIRKVEKMLMHAGLALESVSIRLSTVSELGEVLTVLAPAAGVLNNIRSGMSGIFPEAGREIENIGTLLTDIVSTTNQDIGRPVDIKSASLEATKILRNAEVAASKKLQEQLPEVSDELKINEKTDIIN